MRAFRTAAFAMLLALLPASAVTAAQAVSVGAAQAAETLQTSSDPVPEIINQAFQPGSDLFAQAIDTLKHQGTLTEEQAQSEISGDSALQTFRVLIDQARDVNT